MNMRRSWRWMRAFCLPSRRWVCPVGPRFSGEVFSESLWLGSVDSSFLGSGVLHSTTLSSCELLGAGFPESGWDFMDATIEGPREPREPPTVETMEPR